MIAFAMPRSVLDGPLGNSATSVYSCRLNVSYAPHPDHGADLKALERPFLLLAGEADEAFYAERYEGEISRHTNAGTYCLLPGVGHLRLVTEPGAVDTVKDWPATL